VATIVKYGLNWERDEGGFATVFQCDKEDLSRRLNEIKAARDPKQHSRESAPQFDLQAAVQLRWFSALLDDKSLNPYKS
jgi:hypothetical protein